MVLVIDNYDSFVYNLVQYLGELGEVVEVYRNDKISCDRIKDKNPSAIVISPGPGRPSDAGISNKVIERFAGVIPILGVCLGHQCIGEVFGGRIVRAKRLMHGKTSLIHHSGREIYHGVENPFIATRYHSLIIKEDTLASCFLLTAWTKEGEIMGIRHESYPLFGMQFHPESILTKEGMKLLSNFLNIKESIPLRIR
ncbi:aminodeoxychorismate/anthranilate synthase component II [Candidatus Aerophobetes bacterium]|nr:aminodeoxychorismate/anthranilate synthase component II [Candidatus Aerophobetes bacterium]